jgi:hypothetical protein
MSFFLAGAGYSTGGVALDPAVPIEDGEISVSTALVGYAYTLGIGGQSAKVAVLVPYGWLSGSATIVSTGFKQVRDTDGFGDALFKLSLNLAGAPALDGPAFRQYRQRTIVGTTLQVSAPTGRYEPEKLVNLGTNRWSFKPELGVSHALERWIFEGAVAATFYTTNDDYFGGQRREQDPLFAGQVHVIRPFAKGRWAAFNATYYTGGQSTLDGVPSDDRLANWRYGLTVALPIHGLHSLKLYVSEGLATRRGEDATLGGAVWQLRWGGAS